MFSQCISGEMRGELQTGEDSEAELHSAAALSSCSSPRSPGTMQSSPQNKAARIM